jgi:hypothetical protein
VRFRVDDIEFSASVQEVADRGLTIQFRAPKLEMHEALLEAVARRAHVLSLEDEREWRIADVSFGYVGSEPWGMHHHTWRLEQVVRVSGGPLRIADLTFEPYDYREDTAAEGVLRFAFRAAASDSDLRALATLSGTLVEVVRDQEPPRLVLVAGFVWGMSSTHGQAIALVCSEQTEPRVTASGATSLEAQLLALLARNVPHTTDLLELRHVKDVDAWDL